MMSVLRAANYSEDSIRVAFEEEQSRLKLRVNPEINGWWKNLMDKILFAFFLITTIGYGNVSPTTPLGQIVCVIYTMLGLPVAVVMMRLLSLKFRSCLKKLFKIAQTYYPTSKLLIVVIGILCFLIWAGLFIGVSTYVFTITDGWELNKSAYYSFVILSTIGFGDYVAGFIEMHFMDKYYYLHLVLMLVWMSLGLGFVSMIINMLSYCLGVIYEKLSNMCREREAARARTRELLKLIKELNWELFKSYPPDFEQLAEIENFKDILVKNPQEITPEMLVNIYTIMDNLQEKAEKHLISLNN